MQRKTNSAQRRCRETLVSRRSRLRETLATQRRPTQKRRPRGSANSMRRALRSLGSFSVSLYFAFPSKLTVHEKNQVTGTRRGIGVPGVSWDDRYHGRWSATERARCVAARVAGWTYRVWAERASLSDQPVRCVTVPERPPLACSAVRTPVSRCPGVSGDGCVARDNPRRAAEAAGGPREICRAATS